MSRGFGTQFGTGITDAVKTSCVTALATQHSVSAWFYSSSTDAGGGNATGAGRVFARGTGGVETLAHSTATSMKYDMPFTTTNSFFTFNISTNRWQHVLVTYDASSVANKPVVYVNGVSVSVTVITAPVGTFAPTTNNIYIGNDSGANREFGGMLAHIAIWNKILLGSEAARALASGLNPLDISPEQLLIYMPVDGINKPEFDFGNAGPSLSIVASKLGASEPPVDDPYDDDLWVKGISGLIAPASLPYTGGAISEFAISGTPISGSLSPKNYYLSPTSGSYAITGEAAALNIGRTLTPTAGNYAITGRTATLNLARTLALGVGIYAITGGAGTSLTYTPAGGGKKEWFIQRERKRGSR